MAALVPVTIATNLLAGARRIASSADVAAVIDRGSFALVMNFVLVALFVTFFAFAVFVRHRPDWHKRFMLLASISIVAPAVDRLGRLLLSIEPVTSPFVPVVVVSLLLSLIAYDVWVRGRPHVVSVLGVLTFVVSMRLGTLVAQSGFARSLFQSVSGFN